MTFCCVTGLTRGSFFGRCSSTLQPRITLHSPTTRLIIGRAGATHAWRQHSGNVKAPIFLFYSLYYRQIELWASIKQGMDIKEAVGVVKQRRKGGNKERQDGNKFAFSLICDEIFIVKYFIYSFTKSRPFFSDKCTFVDVVLGSVFVTTINAAKWNIFTIEEQNAIK